MIYGYVRQIEGVIPVDPNILMKYGCDKVIIEVGTKKQRHIRFQNLLLNASKGDLIVLYQLSDIVAKYEDLDCLIRNISEVGVEIVSIKDGLDTRAVGFGLKNAVSVISNILGVNKPYRRKGRPNSINDKVRIDLLNDILGKVRIEDILKKYNIGRTTFYTFKRENSDVIKYHTKKGMRFIDVSIANQSSLKLE